MQRREIENTRRTNYLQLATFARADNLEGFSQTLAATNPQMKWKPSEVQNIFKRWRLAVLDRERILIADESIKAYNQKASDEVKNALWAQNRGIVNDIAVTKSDDPEVQNQERERLDFETARDVLTDIKDPVAKEDAARAALQAGFSLTAVAAAVMDPSVNIHNNMSAIPDESGKPQTVIKTLQMIESVRAYGAMRDIVGTELDSSMDKERKKVEKERALKALTAIVGAKRAMRVTASLEEAAQKGKEEADKAITEATVAARRIIRLHAHEFDGLVPRTDGPAAKEQRKRTEAA